MIPDDQYSSGNRDDQCWAKLYAFTKEEANEKRQAYLGRYPIMGYSTRTDWEGWITDKPSLKKYYCIRMSRWHSCD
jgi:hypothetical protein